MEKKSVIASWQLIFCGLPTKLWARVDFCVLFYHPFGFGFPIQASTCFFSPTAEKKEIDCRDSTWKEKEVNSPRNKCRTTD